MKLERTENKLAYLFVFIVFCLTFNAVKYWPLFGITSICYAIGILLPFMICKSFFNTKMFVFFAFYAVVVLINHLLGDEYFSNNNSLLIGFVGFFVSLSMAYFVFSNNDLRLMRAIVVTLIIVLLWTTIASAFFDISNSSMVRVAYREMLNGGADKGMFNYMYALGLSSYALPHAIPILIPPFALGLKNSSLNKKKRVFSGIMLACCLMLAYFSGATGALLVSLVVLIMSLVVRKVNNRTNFVVIVIGIIMLAPFLLNDSLMIKALDSADNLIGGEGYFHSKIIDFQETIIYGKVSGDVEVRGNLYNTTAESILSHPFLGTLEKQGGHSALFDRFASLGLLGFIPLMGVIVSQAKYIQKHISSDVLTYFYLSLFAAFMMLASKNVSGWNMWFFLFAAMPFLLVYYSRVDIQS